ncbi:hypothetical protein [Tenacibaculum sp. 190524A02b]
MARNSILMQQRNNDIKKTFLSLQNDNPNWKFSAIIDELSGRFYLSKSRIERILNNN